MKWHCDKDGYCHKDCEAACVKDPCTNYSGKVQYAINCSIIDFCTWIDNKTDKPIQYAVCPVNNLLKALSDKIISNIKENEKYTHDSFMTNKCLNPQFKNDKITEED
jgi:hypothetical protein